MERGRWGAEYFSHWPDSSPAAQHPPCQPCFSNTKGVCTYRTTSKPLWFILTAQVTTKHQTTETNQNHHHQHLPSSEWILPVVGVLAAENRLQVGAGRTVPGTHLHSFTALCTCTPPQARADSKCRTSIILEPQGWRQYF